MAGAKEDKHQENITRQVFGWNPFDANGKDPSTIQRLPQWAAANHEIAQLTDLYQQQLAELAGAHSLLMDDQERFAAMLAPYVNPEDGTFKEPPDETVLLMKKFEEDCRRIQQTERKLQRKIEDCTLTYETSLVEAKGYAETRLLEQIREQQKLIQCQQVELDELRFQRDLYADESLRLRQLCRFGHFDPPRVSLRTPPISPRTLHREYTGAKPPFAWMRQIRYSKGPRDKDSKRGKRNRQPVTTQKPDRPFRVSHQHSSAEHASDAKDEPSQNKGAGDEGLLGRVGGYLGMKKFISETPATEEEPLSSGAAVTTSVARRLSETKSLPPLSEPSSPRPHLDRPTLAELDLAGLRGSGIGLPIGTRSSRHSSRQSFHSSPGGSRKKVVPLPKPTTISELTAAEPLTKDAVSKFFDT